MSVSIAERLLHALPELVRMADPARAFAAFCHIANREQCSYILRVLFSGETPDKEAHVFSPVGIPAIRVSLAPGAGAPPTGTLDALMSALKALAGALEHRASHGAASQTPDHTLLPSRREEYLAALTEVQRRLLAFSGDGPCYESVLELLGRVSGASRVYVFENHRAADGTLLMSQRAEWCAEGVTPQIDNPMLQNLPYDDYVIGLAKGHILTGLVKDLPDVARRVLEPQEILAILLLPLTVHGEFYGFIGFDNCAEARPWDPPEIDLLNAAAGAIALAIERQIATRQQTAYADGMRAVVSAANELIACPDMDTVLRRAVELARERIGLERCAIFLDEGDRLRGTYGTDRLGRTTDETQQVFTKDDYWSQLLQLPSDGPARWTVRDEMRLEWDGQRSVPIGRGWVAVTPILQSASQLIGALVNDAAISGAPVDVAKQEIALVYCSLLGNILQRKRAEEQVGRMAAELEARVAQRTTELESANAALHAQIAERRKAEKERARLAEEADKVRAFLQAAIDTVPVGLVMTDASGMIALANGTAISMLGYDPTSRNLKDELEDRCKFLKADGLPCSALSTLSHVLASGQAVGPAEHRIQRADGTCITALTSVAPVLGQSGRVEGAVAVLMDVSLLKDREHQLEIALARAEEGSRLLQTLMEYIPEGVIIADAPDLTVKLVSSTAAAMVDRTVSEIMAMPLEERHRVFDIRTLDGIPVPSEQLPLVRATRSGEVVQGEEYVLRTPWGSEVSILCNAGPIRNQSGKITGGIVVFRDVTALRKAREELQRSYETERYISATLQKAFLPRLPDGGELPGFIAVGRYQPAHSTQRVGGDFYDIFPLPNGSFGIAIGDVAGKGVEAAERTALVKYSLRAHARIGLDPGDTLAAVNVAFWDAYGEESAFITLFYGEFDPSTGVLRYANAGHEPPLVLVDGKKHEELHSTGPALGSFEHACFQTHQTLIPPGARLLLYT
ncbi:MAG: SpoIIE family protein phosphatase, partial [Armatimonadota bacterium]